MHIPHSFTLPPDLQQPMQLALEYRKGGRPAEAAALYRELLARFPQQADVLGQLGELLMQQGDLRAALPLLEQARQTAPANALHWLLLTQCLLGLDRAKDAKKVISEAISKGLRHPLADELLRQARSGNKKKPEKPVPLNESLRQLEALLQAGRYAQVEALGQELQRRHSKTPQVWYLLGMAALLQGRLQEAIPPLRRAVELNPGMAPAQFNLGFALDGLGRLDEALEAYRKAATAAPQLADAHNNLGNVLKKLLRHEEALLAYERAVALHPEIAEYHVNRGDALRVLERLDEALAAYEIATGLKPGFAEGYANLGFVLHLLGRNEESVTAFEHAIELRPVYFEAYQGMGHTLRRLDRHADAAEAYRRAADLRPDDAVAHKDLGMELRESARYEAAIAPLRRALELKPDFDLAITLLAGTLLDVGRVEEALEMYRRGLARDPGSRLYLYNSLLFALNYQADNSPGRLLAEARAFGEEAARLAKPFAHHDNVCDPERRLRIGLVSGDFGQHPVGFFLMNVVESLDPNAIELYAYATVERKDELADRLRRSIPFWRDAGFASMSDEVLADRIRADGIDILVDLAGHTANNRLSVFAWKPAPVQVAWLGFFATTGLAAMDYILADRWVLPSEEEGGFVEKPWRLPDSYYCFTSPNVPVEVAKLPALENARVTFGCFNNLTKQNDRVIACWARVLKAVPGSQLFLKSKALGDASVAIAFRERFASHGIGPERLRMEGASPRADYLAAFNSVDIALDPFPYPGGTTSIEGLWMGVPVLTLKGDRFIGHQGETILHSAGLTDWIAENEDDYVAKAAAFARDVEQLAALRARLRGQVLASPLFDAPRFARNLEAAFRGMWRNWCEQQKAPGQDG